MDVKSDRSPRPRIDAGGIFFATVSALVYTVIADRRGESAGRGDPPNAVVNFVVSQHRRMPDYLRAPLKLLTLLFSASTLPGHRKLFHRLESAARSKQIDRWRRGRFGFQRDLIRIYESLAVFGGESLPADSKIQPVRSQRRKVRPLHSRDRCEILVIGSGPGGAVTACQLAEAGRDVMLVEEGNFLPLDSCQAFTLAEMEQKYRNGGVTAALGNPKIAYVEGRCVGGGSEVNSALYHRTPAEILEKWAREFGVVASREADLLPHFQANESELSVSKLPGPAPAVSRKLQEGADRLHWRSMEVPRWFTFDGGKDDQGVPTGIRRSMTRSMIPRALDAGCRLFSGTRARRIRRSGETWTLYAADSGGRDVRIEAESVFISCGAIHTPALLQRSGFSGPAGRSLQMHPTVKMIAEFPERIGSPIPGVGVHQVKQFAPEFSFGCSISSLPYLALAMLDHRYSPAELHQRWLNMASYYSMISASGAGSVRSLPGFDDPLVRYALTESDMRTLGTALQKLGELLFAAGAVALYPSINAGPALRSPDELSWIPKILTRGAANLMTIHLFSSCPMGENRSRCVADSFGRVHRADNLYIADASLLCTAPTVNPQGSIMAFARRNALKFLNRL
jgi:choline dehydrogenase-like flavoprotein